MAVQSAEIFRQQALHGTLKGLPETARIWNQLSPQPAPPTGGATPKQLFALKALFRISSSSARNALGEGSYFPKNLLTHPARDARW